ncbi:MAG: Gfo/Idh/MocA family oxidoreductase [Spirochaetes bacterium]|nr:Gfo/Idh/MocA family oxidoreductase [Spirochaetota bacterium]
MKKIKVGVIGAGGIAQYGHIPSYKTIEGVEITALSDPNEAKLHEVKDKFSIDKAFTDYKKLLEIDEIDAVSICTPNYLHARMALDALRCGKNVLCEKPFAVTAKEAEEVIREAEKSGKILLENLSLRYDLTHRIIQEYVREERLGRLYYAKCSYLRRKGHPGIGGWFTNKKESGGGCLIDLGIHMLDLALCSLGQPKPVSVTASTYDYLIPQATDGGWPPDDTRINDDFDKKVDIEDLATAFIKFNNGSTLLLEAGWAGYSEIGVKVSLFGTKAGVELVKSVGGIDEHRPIKFTLYEEHNGRIYEIHPETPSTYSYWEDSFPFFIRHFIACIRGEEEPGITPDEILLRQKIIDAVYLSAEKGITVTF